MARESLGDLEQLVLLATLRLDDRAYGVSIVDEIRERSQRSVSRAAVYIVLRRLQRKGLLSSTLAEPTPERGGRGEALFFCCTLGACTAQPFARRAHAHVGWTLRGSGQPMSEKTNLHSSERAS